MRPSVVDIGHWRTRCSGALLLVLLAAGCSRCGSGSSVGPQAQVESLPSRPGAAAPAVPEVEPVATPTILAQDVPVPQPKGEASGPVDCKNAVAAFAAGNSKAFQSLSSERKAALSLDTSGESVFTCLAVGSNDKRFCEVLSDDAKAKCLETWELVGKVKEQPSDEAAIELAANQMSGKCREAFSEGDCANLRAAMVSGSAGKCQGLDEKLRPLCVGFATGDDKGCPAEGDCKMLTAAFKRLKKEGRAGFENSPIIDKAAREGAAACASLVTQLEGRCEAK